MLTFINEKQDCWDFLSSCDIPIFIYGMGDGALKIMSVMEKYRIPVAGFFASDEYVRGHFFEQHKVHTLSEIEGFLDNFVILLAFAAGYPALVDRINSLAERYTLLAPDVPVAGEQLFTYDYCVQNADKLDKVYSLLADDKSKEVFANVINFKISGKISYLNEITTPKSEIFEDIIKLSENEVYVDLGAYNGDTVTEFLENTNKIYDKIYAVEPDNKNYKKLIKSIDGIPNITPIKAAAWQCDTTLNFANMAGRQSAVSSRGILTPARSVDSILNGESCTLIKMDVEGAEKKAILGAKSTIEHFSPKLIISLYHRSEDMFELPLLINQINPDYKLYIRHQLYIPAWETNLYVTL